MCSNLVPYVLRAEGWIKIRDVRIIVEIPKGNVELEGGEVCREDGSQVCHVNKLYRSFSPSVAVRSGPIT